MNWENFFKNRKYRNEFIITIILLVIVLFILTNFLDFVETRSGVVLPDPILALFNPINLTWLTFGLIYLSIVLALINFIPNPKQLMFVLQVYVLMIIFRIAAMYILPLNPPDKMILLNDPFVQLFGTGKVLTKDLFFSGHTATLFLLFLCSPKTLLKKIYFVFTILIAASVLLQHVHYSIDVLAAPFFTYAAYRIVIILREKYAFL